MRDYEGELPKTDERVVYRSERMTKVCRRKPYNDVLYALGEYAKIMALTHGDRTKLRQMAWFLGMEGQHQACEVIMEHAAEKPYDNRRYMYLDGGY